MLYNMRQVEVNGLDGGVLVCDDTKCGPHTFTRIHHMLKILKPLIGFNDLIGNHNCVVKHGRVEGPVVYGVLGRILKRVYSMGPIEWYSSFSD